MKNELLALLMFAGLSSAHADFGTRGGGEAVVCKVNGKETVDLFDFYEVPARYKFKLDLGGRNKDYYEKVNDKIKEIARVDLKYAQNLEKELKVFKESHNKIPEDQLRRIYDSGSPIKVSKNCKKHQFAVNRRFPKKSEYKYLINVDLWNKADNNVRAGLIMHELIYGLYWKIIGLQRGVPDSNWVRYYNAFVHSKGFGQVGDETYHSEFPGKGRVRQALNDESIDSLKLNGLHIHNIDRNREDGIWGYTMIEQEFDFRGQRLKVEKDVKVSFSREDRSKIIAIEKLIVPLEVPLGDQTLRMKSFQFETGEGGETFRGTIERQKIWVGNRMFFAEGVNGNSEGQAKEGYIRGLVCLNCNFGVRVNIRELDLILDPTRPVTFGDKGEVRSGTFWTLKDLRLGGTAGYRGKQKIKAQTHVSLAFYNPEEVLIWNKIWNPDPFPADIRVLEED